MNIIKRSGIEVEFNRSNIYNAVQRANLTSNVDNRMDDDIINSIVNFVEKHCKKCGRAIHVEEIQDLVEDRIMKLGFYNIARNYIKYRHDKEMARRSNTTDSQILSIIENVNEEVKQENSNKNPTIASVQRDYMAGEVSKDVCKRILLPKDVVQAHEAGLIHFHDMDYFAQHIYNCCLVSLDDMLQNGTVISNVMIEKPHSFSTACNIAMQIVAQVASSQYGGQSISIAHLAPFVDISRQKIKKEILEICGGCEKDENKLNEIVEKRLANEIRQGVQCLNFQCYTLQTTNGQTPFVTFFMYLNEAKSEQEKHDLALIIEEILKQRIQGVKNNQGVWVSPAFPKLIYVLEEDNCSEGTKYWPLTELAAKCTAKRLVPDYISEKKMMEAKLDEKGEGHCFAPMGCRSMLSPYTEHASISDDGTVWTEMVNGGELVIEDENTQIIKPTKKYTVKAKAMNGTIKDFFVEVAEKHADGSIKLYLYKTFFYSRFNQGVVTLNLVDVALSANKNLKSFWKILDARLELCHKALRCRHERLMGTTSDIAPILWQYGAIARLKPGEKINKLLHGTYSTISLGYAGLWECVLALIDKKLTETEGMSLGLEIMKKLNEATEKWKVAEDIGYGIYGTPLESTTYRFAKCLQKRFGIVKDVTDHGYITNSYHVNVREPIDAFTKLDNEAKFQLLSTGGAISYVEVPNMQNNIEAVLAIIKHIYENIIYAELNTKSDYCMKCHFDGEIKAIEDKNGKLVWECPKCGNRDFTMMSVTRRTCGYIGSQGWNQGRTEEIKDRVLHI